MISGKQTLAEAVSFQGFSVIEAGLMIILTASLTIPFKSPVNNEWEKT